MNSHVGFALPRRPQVLAMAGFSPSALDREIRKGLFPPPIRLSPDPTSRAVGWVEAEIATVNAAKVRGENEDAIRKLVADLVAARSTFGVPTP